MPVFLQKYICFNCSVPNQCIYFPPSSTQISVHEANRVTKSLGCTARPKAAWQTGEAQRDRARKSDHINRAPRDKRENIEASSADSDLR